MGTNYYLTIDVCGPECPKCGHMIPNEKKIHIGKASAGWTFALRIHPNSDITSLNDWIKVMGENPIIHNEYDERVTKEFMLRQITERGNPIAPGFATRETPAGYTSWIQFHARNHSVEGPHGLLRRREDDETTHGEGTWDYVLGEFS